MSSITDKPVKSVKDDLLKVEKYSRALSNFITRSETPITVGLQGEWGTGKTSLMSLLLEDFNNKSIACSWVNTWEYSMFRGANETTPEVLKGMLEKLKQSCTERGLWTLKDESKAKFKKAAKFLGGLANQVVAKNTGMDIKSASDGTSEKGTSTAEIAEIKILISDLIRDLVNDPRNPVKKVVFFVDDLDRIPPGDAVEVLEALKNVFDIPHCVFILAIDYDVVVKGLEDKFGPKTEENEREFRSFFDKIIQVPFSMPTGTYDIENFLVEKLKILGLEVKDDEKELYTKSVRFTIGYNPRSLKRYLNSFSLINHLREINDDEDSDYNDYMLFSILGIQISYPKIFRLLSQNPNFLNWDSGFANKFGIEWDVVQEKIKKFGESELIDEEWEQVVWGACQKDPYLKTRAFALLELLNLLRDKFKDTLEIELENAMAFASITSVDDDIETKQAVQKVGNKTIFNGVESKLTQLQNEGYPTESTKNFAALWQPLNELVVQNEKYRISFAKTGTTFNDETKPKREKQLIYCTNPGKRSMGMRMWIKSNTGKVNAIHNSLKEKFALHESENIWINKHNDLIIEQGLYNEKKAVYTDILDFIVRELT